MTSVNYSQLLYLYVFGILDELNRWGVKNLVISPGARSTPLTSVAARMQKFQLTVVYDERGAGFTALGIAKASGKPVGLICTSGTAVANYLPAVVEARMSGIPLILLTADRPAELRWSGANQTIIQPGIFSHYVKAEIDLPVPGNYTRGEKILTMLDRIIEQGLQNPPGPVHINCQFRKPLEPEKPTQEQIQQFFPDGWIKNRQPINLSESTDSGDHSVDWSEIRALMESAKRPFLFLGDLRVPLHVVTGKISELPFGIDPTQASTVSGRGYIPFLDLMLLNATFRENFRPDVWLQIGTRPTSTRIENQLKNISLSEYIHIHTQQLDSDPAQKVTRKYIIQTEQLFRLDEQLFNIRAHDEWTAWLREVNGQVAEVVQQFLQQDHKINQWQVFAGLKQAIPDSHLIFLGNSNAVRLPDILGLQQSVNPVFTNRGASGIDGNIATVAGIAQTVDRPVTVLIGDLAFHHDMNSLDLLKYARNKVIFIVLNNHGGGIFHMLPISGHQDIFEQYFGTPHSYVFRYIARHFGLNYYHSGNSIAECMDTYSSALKAQNHSIVEIELDRYYDKQLFDELAEKIRNLQIKEGL